MTLTLQQLDRIEARIEMGLLVICIGCAFVVAASALSIYRNLRKP